MPDPDSPHIAALFEMTQEIFRTAIPRDLALAAKEWHDSLRTNPAANAERLRYKSEVDRFIRALPDFYDGSADVRREPIAVVGLAIDRMAALPQMLANPPLPPRQPTSVAGMLEDWLVVQWSELFARTQQAN